MAGGIEIRVLGWRSRPESRHGETPGRSSSCLSGRPSTIPTGPTAPADLGAAGPLGGAGGRGAGTRPDAGARPGVLPAAAPAANDDEQGPAGPIPDLVARDFTARAPGEKMVGDITYIPTWEGWAFLATVIDCATRKVIGWAMDDNYRTPLISRRSRWPRAMRTFPQAPCFTLTAAAIIRRPSAGASWKGWESASRWADRLVLRQCPRGIV